MAPTADYPLLLAALERDLAAADFAAAVDRLAELAAMNNGAWGFGEPSVRDTLRLLPGPPRRQLLAVLLERARTAPGSALGGHLFELAQWVVLGLALPNEADVLEMVLDVAGEQWTDYDTDLPGQAWSLLELGRPLPPGFVAMMRRTVAGAYYGHRGLAPVLAKLTDLPLLNPGEAWADRVMADASALGWPWHELVAHAGTATATKINKTFEKRGRELLHTAGTDKAATMLASWLELVGRPRTRPVVRPRYGGDVNEAYDPVNVTTLRGLIWLTGLLTPRPDTARLLGAVAETSLRKVSGIGPRSPKIANTAVHTLARIDSDEALAQLARLAARLTYKSTLKEVNTALDVRAAALGLTRAEVEELAVPAYGLTSVGRRVDDFGGVLAETTVGAAGVRTSWVNAAGRAVKSAPATVRSDHAEGLRELKAAVKDIEKMLTAQAERLDRQFLAQRSWTYPAWRARYLDHPLLGTLTRRLIWLVGDQACAWGGTGLTTLDNGPAEVEPDAAVRLWHPIGRPVEEVLAWRERLERDEVVQPFKQAHREVYVLTAAEENTGTYSNRYAAHVLRQHQFHALAAARGWRNRLRLMVDDEYPPATRDLPEWGLRAEYWVEGIGDDYGDDTTDSGSYLRIVTDQVRFYATGAREHTAHAGGGGYRHGRQHPPADGLPLTDIPPLVFSEVMRDVDLFVGVASVGNDPTWQDGGPGGRFQDYWNSYSFGGLSGTAQTRRDLLTRIVPRLAIADRATIEDRFLVVRGDLRTYRIHLGSGNILMSPNDQYLCIVPNQSATADTGGVFLPFDGDRVLAVILSKAMLLARDTAITDPTITRQIRT
ncbi:DUF4132 domain-containing protein [Catellatospora citrea]|uniref:DUF4132 domain-containing protein n=1 Tax=Catellatospora citrea TaxID=53366 RepID=A0A8J3KGW0_9ACTN|nr:DUF4132 domain-containing protein [Catellatospora citrea]RKE02715.1 uncharacterized protein DUF4132 [Catellatospora citrea]GIF99547.1 hypothetical protein Cci01nite_46410 [Catellatospora citrea]